jgi:AbrB family looped-hinge helix DNA binding protein
MNESHEPATTILRERGQVTIPADVRNEAEVTTGAVLEFSVEDGRIIITPKMLVDANQAWFWSDRWQRMEREADSDIASGRTAVFEDVESLLRKLDS